MAQLRDWWERVYGAQDTATLTRIGFWISAASLLATILGYWKGIPLLLFVRDILIFAFLFGMAMLWFAKGWRHELRVKQLQAAVAEHVAVLTEQAERFHTIAHDLRSTTYAHVGSINGHPLVSAKDKNEFERLCGTVTREVKAQLETYYRARGITLEDRLQVSVALLMPHHILLNTLKEELLPGEDGKIAATKGTWVVTIYWDAVTWETQRGKGLRADNADRTTPYIGFSTGEISTYACDDIQSAVGYRDEHQRWKGNYDAKLVKAIRATDRLRNSAMGNGGPNVCLGVLVVETRNSRCQNLFENDLGAKSFVAHGADILAQYMLSLGLEHSLNQETYAHGATSTST